MTSPFPVMNLEGEERKKEKVSHMPHLVAGQSYCFYTWQEREWYNKAVTISACLVQCSIFIPRWILPSLSPSLLEENLKDTPSRSPTIFTLQNLHSQTKALPPMTNACRNGHIKMTLLHHTSVPTTHARTGQVYARFIFKQWLRWWCFRKFGVRRMKPHPTALPYHPLKPEMPQQGQQCS